MISPQLLSISPTRQRPSSAKGASSVVVTSNFASRKASPSAHSATSRKPLAATTPTVMASAALSPLAPDAALTVNLKQQIACLEMEVKFLKQQGTAPASTTSNSRVRLATNTSLGSEGMRLTSGGGGGGGGGAAQDLFRRAEELDDQVVRLRRQYVEREQAHALEVASLREELNGTGSSVSAAVTAVKDEAERRERQHRHEAASMRALHGQEAILLQKTVERLQMEATTSRSLQQTLQSEKEHLAKEVISLHDNLRTALANVDSEAKQKQEAMAQLGCEQERRRSVEVKEADLRVELAGLSKGTLLTLESKVAEAEKARRALQIDLQAKVYDLEHAKLTIEKQGKDLAQAAADSLETASKDLAVKEAMAQLEAKLAKAAAGLSDLQSEKEYYRLQTDRLKVEGAVLDVKCKQAEQQLVAERASIVALEKQHCTALEHIEALRRDAAAKDDLHRSMDSSSTQIRLQQRILQEERADLEKQLRVAKEELVVVRREYETIRHYADAAKRDGQIQNALMKLTKTKEEMQNLLSVQARLSSDINEAMCDLPDSTTISRIVSPPRRTDSPPQQQQQQPQETVAAASATAVTFVEVPVDSTQQSTVASAPPTDAAQIQREMDALLKGIQAQEATLPSLLGHN